MSEDSEEKEILEEIKNNFLSFYFDEGVEYTPEDLEEIAEISYNLMGLPPPRIYVFDDPMQVQVAANIIEEKGNYHGEDLTQVPISNLKYVPFAFRDVSDAGWVIFGYFYEKTGRVKHEVFTKYRKAFMKTPPFLNIMYEEVWLVSQHPQVIKRDARNRLHCTTGPAIEFRSGYAQYYVNGVFFSEGLFKKVFLEECSISDILDIANIERRTAAIMNVGMELVQELPEFTVLDEHDAHSHVTGKPVTYLLFEFKYAGDVRRCVIWEDHTTHKRGPLLVPRTEETDTCLGALAWSFEMSQEEYILEMES